MHPNETWDADSLRIDIDDSGNVTDGSDCDFEQPNNSGIPLCSSSEAEDNENDIDDVVCRSDEEDANPVQDEEEHITYEEEDRIIELHREFVQEPQLSSEDLRDLEVLEEKLHQARCKRYQERETLRHKGLDGVGAFVNELRGCDSEKGNEKKRIVLSESGHVVKRRRDMLPCAGGAMMVEEPPTFTLNLQELEELPPPPPRPSDPAALRRLVRSKMVRCKVCKNRFGEKHLLERHLRDHHEVEYIEYLYYQELEVQRQREEELERNRIEELTSGGFIPPESSIDAKLFDVNPNMIPLPGELSGGIPARMDPFGRLREARRFRKKISPQCVFCDKRFRNEISLRKHIEKKHPESIEFVQCLECFKCLPSKDDLLLHVCDMTFLCVECSPIRNLCSEERLLRHRLKFHRGINSGFKCTECNMKFLTPRKLRKHKKMSHVFVKTYPCHFCEELFISEVGVVTHERIHTGIIKFECKICDYKCNRYLEMEAHKKDEHGYVCSICHEKFGDWAEVKNHTLKDHGGYLSNEAQSGYIESPRVWIMYKGD